MLAVEEPLSTRIVVSRNQDVTARLGDLSALRDSKVQHKKYEEAAALHRRIAEEVAAFKRDRRAEELTRQHTEQGKLLRSRHAALAHVTDDAAQQHATLRDTWAARFEELGRRQQREVEELDDELYRKTAGAKLIYSSATRDMQLAEAKLAAFHDYAESRMCRRKLQALEQGDRAALREELEKRATAARARLRRQHEAELRFAETQMRGAEGSLARRMQARRQLLQRRYANLGDDMRHSHKVDLTQKPGMAFYTQPHFIKLRPKKPGAGGGGGGGGG
eukprot:Rhum_TRINITY_DN3843_c0_g2::Rhum_TRINITY_DN3843_c0_g2_i1::g.12051::m.12051